MYSCRRHLRTFSANLFGLKNRHRHFFHFQNVCLRTWRWKTQQEDFNIFQDQRIQSKKWMGKGATKYTLSAKPLFCIVNIYFENIILNRQSLFTRIFQIWIMFINVVQSLNPYTSERRDVLENRPPKPKRFPCFLYFVVYFSIYIYLYT